MPRKPTVSGKPADGTVDACGLFTPELGQGLGVDQLDQSGANVEAQDRENGASSCGRITAASANRSFNLMVRYKSVDKWVADLKAAIVLDPRPRTPLALGGWRDKKITDHSVLAEWTHGGRLYIFVGSDIGSSIDETSFLSVVHQIDAMGS